MKYKIEVKNLVKNFGEKTVLDGINLNFSNRSSTVILGGSGTGKSVLIKNIIGLMTPNSGDIFIDGTNTTKLRTSERFKLMEKCGYLFQSGALFDSLSVQENIIFFASKLNKMKRKEKRDLAASKLKSVGLSPDILDLYPSELSGGMQKRVALARTICTNPEIIFFDEPTTGLDPIMSNVINDLIIKVREELGATTITITHDINSAKQIGQQFHFLYQGKIHWSGSKDDLTNSDNEYMEQFLAGKIQGPIKIA